MYVDDMNAPYGRMKMCHMIADTTQELLAMAARIGVQSKWIQQKGTYQEHFDICLAKKAMALDRGAIPITLRELAVKTQERRPGGPIK